MRITNIKQIKDHYKMAISKELKKSGADTMAIITKNIDDMNILISRLNKADFIEVFAVNGKWFI